MFLSCTLGRTASGRPLQGSSQHSRGGLASAKDLCDISLDAATKQQTKAAKDTVKRVCPVPCVLPLSLGKLPKGTSTPSSPSALHPPLLGDSGTSDSAGPLLRTPQSSRFPPGWWSISLISWPSAPSQPARSSPHGALVMFFLSSRTCTGSLFPATTVTNSPLWLLGLPLP